MYNFLKYDEKTQDLVAEKIIEIENKYNIKFPEIFKTYLINYNNVPTKTAIIYEGTGSYGDYEIAKIIPVISQSSASLIFENIVDNDREDGWISNTFFPLASDRGGDIYYWDCKTNKVFMVRADDIELPIEICDSVDDFFDLYNNGKFI